MEGREGGKVIIFGRGDAFDFVDAGSTDRLSLHGYSLLFSDLSTGSTLTSCIVSFNMRMYYELI